VVNILYDCVLSFPVSLLLLFPPTIFTTNIPPPTTTPNDMALTTWYWCPTDFED